MNKLALTLVTMAICMVGTIGAQETWSLERCVKYALDHSLDLRQSRIDAKQAEVNQIAAKQLRYPNLTGSTGYDVSFGRQVDRATNDFINERFGNQNLRLNTNVTLFNGGRINNQIKQSALGLQAAELEAEQMSNDISLMVANAFIQILFAKENLSNAEKSRDLISSQLENIDKLIAAGSRPRNERLDLVAQFSQNEQMVVAAANDVDIATLSLKQLLQLDIGVEMDIEVPDIALPSDYDVASLDANEIYQTAKSWQPGIKAGELRKKNAEIGVALARTAMIPELSLGAGAGTFYSTAAKSFFPTGGTSVIPFTNLLGGSTQGIFLNGESTDLSAEVGDFRSEKTSYGDQLNQNLGFGVGVSLSVPIYNQGRSKGNHEIAKLEVVRSEIANEQVKNTLKTNVQRSVADLKAAKKQFEAATSTAEANRAAYSDAEKRFGLGVSNNLEFTTAQTNRDRAEVDLIIAKYDYIFKSKVLDFYMGKQITLN